MKRLLKLIPTVQEQIFKNNSILILEANKPKNPMQYIWRHKCILIIIIYLIKKWWIYAEKFYKTK